MRAHLALGLLACAACGDVPADERSNTRPPDPAPPNQAPQQARVGLSLEEALRDALDQVSLPSPLGTGASQPPGNPGDTSALASERDRLLDGMATSGDRCTAWTELDDDQRAVFLLVTDLLGKRTLLADGTSALVHVVQIYAVRGRQQDGCLRCCGDSEFNRIYIQADEALIAAWRLNALDTWRRSHDLAGPHTPFSQSSETHEGQPRGQLHLFATDADMVPLGRVGVEDVVDPHAVEIDIDFNLIHESSPLCSYSGKSGLQRYQDLWADQVMPGDAELGYLPTGC